MPQDIFITVQPFTGDNINIDVSPNMAGVHFVNGRDGIVILNKSDVNLQNVENISILGTSGYLQYQIDQLDTGYASQTEINTLSGLLAQTGSNLNSIINNLSGYSNSNFYPNTNPSGFITVANLSPYATVANLQSTGQNLQNQINNLDLNYASDLQLSQTGSNLQQQINNLYGSGFITGIDLSHLYPRSNPSGFITGVNLSNYATVSNLALTGSNLQNQINNLDLNFANQIEFDTLSGNLISTGTSLQNSINTLSSNLELTGSNLQNQINNLDNTYATDIALSQTGQSLNQQINNLSGSSVLLYGTQFIEGNKIFRGEVRIKDLYVTGTETIVNTTNTNVGNNYILLNATGGAIDAGIFIVTGSGLTGVNDIGAIIGYDVPANRWVFGNTSRGSDLINLEKIAGISDLTNYSGFANNQYSTISNLAITGSTLQSSINAVASNLATTGQSLNTIITNYSGFVNNNFAQITGLNQSYRNLYISDTIGDDFTARIGSINLPYKTAQAAWNAISSSLPSASYILNFYGNTSTTTNYSINVGNIDWPSNVGVRGIGPGPIQLTITHDSIGPSTANGKNFNITDWGYQSISLLITSIGGNWAGGLPMNGGNGGDITLKNCLFNTITTQGGAASSSNRWGVFGSVNFDNCKGQVLNLNVGSNGIGPVSSTPSLTFINSDFSINSTATNIPGTHIIRNSNINFPQFDFVNSNRYYKNATDTRTNTYYIDTAILSGNRFIKNFQISDSAILSGNLTGIVLHDNITGRLKSGYRQGAFVADFASGIYLYPFIESPNLVYNTGNQNISGIKNFISRPQVNGIGVVLQTENDPKYYYVNNQSIVTYENPIYNVNFDGANEIKGAYTSGDVSLNGKTWSIVEGLIGTEAGEILSAPRSLRLRGFGISQFLLQNPLAYGLSNFTFDYRRYSTDLQATWNVDYDINQSNTWINVGSFTAGATTQTFTGNVNATGNIRVRIVSTLAGTNTRRVNLDNFVFNPNYTNLIDNPLLGSKFLCDTSSGSFTFPLPTGIVTGYYYIFTDPYKNWATNNLILSGNNNVIESDGNLFTGDINGAEMKSIFVGSNIGWRVI